MESYLSLCYNYDILLMLLRYQVIHFKSTGHSVYYNQVTQIVYMHYQQNVDTLIDICKASYKSYCWRYKHLCILPM